MAVDTVKLAVDPVKLIYINMIAPNVMACALVGLMISVHLIMVVSR